MLLKVELFNLQFIQPLKHIKKNLKLIIYIQDSGENDDDEFEGGSGMYTVDVFDHYVVDDRCLTLKQKSFMCLFVELYLNHDVNVLLDCMIAKCHSIEDFTSLSCYLYNEQFAYSSRYFGGRMSEINCMLMTFIALSDVNFCNNSSSFVDGGVLSIIFIFFQFF